MPSMQPSLRLIRVLAGEGDFHLYRLLRERLLFLFIKCLLNSLAWFRGNGSETAARSVAFVKGANQSRYFRYARAQLTAELGSLQLYESAPPPANAEAILLPRFQARDVARQTGFLLMMLMTGKRRYLNLYLMQFAAAVRHAVDKGLPSVESFVCFNDQPYDVAAVVFALNQRKTCRTIVIQHGLVLSPNFYFPAVASEFWAWGELSKQHYRAWDKGAQLVVKGRYQSDAAAKADTFVWPPQDRPVRILIAPSFFHDEVKTILTEIDKILSPEVKKTVRIAIKFHPATKLIWRLRWWCHRHVPWLSEEHEPMEQLATKYDALVTKNSTSSVDFLLRGKPIFVINLHSRNDFPSPAYTLELKKIFAMEEFKQSANNLNAARLNFLQTALNT